MYLASIFNDNALFQYFGGWKKQKENNNNSLFNEFLFRASSAYLSIQLMDKLSRSCIDQFERQTNRLEIKNQRIVFWSPTVSEILHEFSPFLSSMRVMQNIIFRLSANECNPNSEAPKSLHEAMKKGLNRYGMERGIEDLFVSYWNESGKLVKDYRDIDQHYYSIAKRCYIKTGPERRILFFLPDDPSNKSQKGVSFKHEIDAIDLFKLEFFRFHDFVENIALSLGFEKAIIDQPVEGEIWFGDKDEEKERMTLILAVLDIDTGLCVELGQQDDPHTHKLYINYLKPIDLRPGAL